MYILEKVLEPAEVARISGIFSLLNWDNSAQTAGTQSAKVKHNQQLAMNNPAAIECAQIVQLALARHAEFLSAALPKHIFPPQFNRYSGNTNHFGNHVDNAIRTHVNEIQKSVQHIRTDLSATLFLSDPNSYEGGELVIVREAVEDRVKLAAGNMVLYDAGTLHRVEPVTTGARTACFFWVESMVQRADARAVLYRMDTTIRSLRETHGDTAEAVQLTGIYHNLLRMWVQTS